MGTEVILNFKDKRKVKASLCAPFRPEQNMVSVALSPDQKSDIPLDQLCYICLVGPRSSSQEAKPGGQAQQVELVSGERLSLSVRPDQVFSTGFFGVSPPDDRLFVIASAVRGADREYLALVGGESAQGSGPPFGMAGKAAAGGSPEPEKDWSQVINGFKQEELNHLSNHNARVGDILITEGLVTKEQVEAAMLTGGKKKIGATLMERGLVTEDQLLAALAAKFNIRLIDLTDVTPSKRALESIPKNLANQMQVLPIELAGKTLVVATSEPTDSTISDSLRFITNYHIETVIAAARQIFAAIERFYNAPGDSLDTFINEMDEEQPVVVDQPEDSDYIEPDSKVILLVNRILIEAYRKGVSDIHFEPELEEGPLVVRYRLDGECVLSHEIPAAHKKAVVARLKIMAKLDIAERRKPQSGKIFLLYENRKLEYRVETTPTVEGHEDAVLRLLTAAKPLSLTDMGFSEENLRKFTGLLGKPYGIILCAGPTGSGKTTTLHSALATINSPERKIWTAEDPVEIIQKGLRQVQVNAKIGFNFAEAMRSFLRADPDVIMIGEMRDPETTKTAIAASLTGHLVFSTLHTNSAPETVGRLIEMGVDPYNFSDALLGIIAQRLTRKLCDDCKLPYRPTREEYQELMVHYGEKWFTGDGLCDQVEGVHLMKKVGCEKCGGTGYRGRIALHELLVNSSAIKRAIKSNLPVEELRELAMEEGLRTLKMDGIQKVLQGVTDLPQVLKVCIL